MGGDPIDVGVASVAFVVVDVDKKLTVLDAFTDRAKPFKAGAVRRNHAIEPPSRFGRLEQMVGFQKAKFARERVLVLADDFLALMLQGHRQAKLRADAIAVRPDVSDHTDGLAATDSLENALNNSRGLHVAGAFRSNSAMMSSTRLPRSMESSMTKRSCGVYFKMTALATKP